MNAVPDLIEKFNRVNLGIYWIMYYVSHLGKTNNIHDYAYKTGCKADFSTKKHVLKLQ